MKTFVIAHWSDYTTAMTLQLIFARANKSIRTANLFLGVVDPIYVPQIKLALEMRNIPYKGSAQS